MNDSLHSATAGLDPGRFFDQSLDLLCIADTGGFFRKLNPRWEMVLGYKAGELEGQDFLGLVHPEDLAATQETVRELATNRTVINFANRYRHRDGSYCWLEWCASSDGTLIYATAREVTERKQAEARLEESEKRFRNLFDAMHEGFAFHEVICNDAGEVIDYRYLDINPAFEQLTGLKRETTVGRTVREVLPEIEEEWIQCFGRVALTGIPDERENYVQELDRYYRARAYSPEKGKFAVVFEETTTERRAQRELERREALYNDLVETATDLVWRCDSEGRYIFLNKAWETVFGYSRSEMLGHRFTDFMTSEQAERDSTLFAQLLATCGRISGHETVHLQKNGTPVWLVFNAGFYHDDTGKVIGTQGTAHDITERKRAAEALAAANQRLAESEILYRSLFEQSPDGICLTDPADTRTVYFNTAMHRQLGYTREEFAALRVADYEEQDTPEQIAARIAALGETGSESFESVYRTKQGLLINVLVSLQMLSVGGQPRILAIVRDISERKRMEQSLRESEQLYRNLVETTAAVAWEVDVATLRFSYISPQIEKLSGYLPEQWTDFHFWVNSIHPDDRADAISFCQTETARGLDHSFEYRLIAADGRIVWVQDVVSVSCKDGKPATLRGYFIDITERKQAEAAIAASEERFRATMALSPDIISIIGADGVLLYNSPAALQVHGYTQEELTGRNTFDLIHPDDRDAVGETFKEILAQPTLLKTVQYRYRNKDGSYAWMECSASNQLTNRHINGVIAISRNIDARKSLEEERLRLEQQLLHAQKLESLGVLAGGIAHDFNNILTAIIGNAEMALMRLNPESPALENLERIEKAAARAADLARQMLAYSGKGKFVIEAIDLNRMVEEMGHMLEVSISKKAILRFNLTRSLPAVNVDATQIRQIIMNLVINASEAIGDKSGVIAISTGCLECSGSYLQGAWLVDPLPEGFYVFLEVADTGCGMDKETMAKLFDPFFTTKFTGRGLGMAAVLGIIRGHKGAIKVYSEPGKGSSFKVLLPAGTKPAELFNGETATGNWRGSGLALLVDDEETVRAIGGEMLKELGFEVVTAADGREAVAIFKSRKDISVVILDLTMPRMDGEQCFRELRQLDPQVKVIMSSGFSESEVTQKFAGKGLAGFVQKPYKLTTLQDVIMKLA